jgi:FixJ family two-component response regulator
MIFVIDDDAAVCEAPRSLFEVPVETVEDFPSAEAFLASAALTERDCLE